MRSVDAFIPLPLCKYANSSIERWALFPHPLNLVWPREQSVSDVVPTLILAFKHEDRPCLLAPEPL